MKTLNHGLMATKQNAATVYSDTLTQQSSIESYDRKILMFLDNLKVHHGKIELEWVAERSH